MTAASDNKFPKLIVTEGTAPSSPSAGDQKLYIDSTSHHLSRKNSAGVVTDLEAGGSVTAHACRVSDTTGQAVANNTLTALAMAAADTYDTDAWHDPASSNTKITPNIAGKYRFGGQVTLASTSATGFRLIAIRINGSTYIGLDERPGYAAAAEQYISIGGIEYAMNGSTDYAELIYRHTLGVSGNLSTNASYGCQFWAALIGA